jgi:oligopeptide transport system substrate-binding protein
MSRRVTVRCHRLVPAAVIAALATLVSLVGGCGGSASTSSASPAGASASPAAVATPHAGGTLVITYQSEPQSLDPAINWDEGWTEEDCLFATFLKYASGSGAPGTKLIPSLATALPEITDGGRTYTFRLRKDIRFAPPVTRPVTAADFKWSFERMMKLPLAPATSFYTEIAGAPAFMAGKAAHVSGYQVVDPYTVRVRLSAPDAAFINAISMPFTSPIPKEWVAKWGKQVGRHPLGAGPFMLDHWTTGQELVMKRNLNYFDASKVWLDGVDVKFSIPPSTALLQLERGTVDVLGDGIPPADFQRVLADPTWKAQVAQEPSIEFDYLFMNVQMKPFDNLKVRQAVAWAIDREKIIKLLAGTALPISQIFPAGLPGHVEGSAGEFYGYDQAKAKALLAQAGYPNGFTTTLYTHNVDPWPRLMQSIQNDLAQVGIKATIRTMDRGTYWTIIGQPHKVPAGFMVWRQDYPDPSDFIMPLFSKAAAVPGGYNASFWWSPQVEKLLAQSFGITDQAQRVQTFDQMQQLIMDQAPAVPLYQPKVNSVTSKRVGGFYLHPVWIFDFLDYSLSQ